jgi:arginine exporter protein ArgO
MTNSRRIAGLLGPTLIALALSESMNLDIWTNTPVPVVYLSGTLLFVAGMSIVRVHNRWTRDWTVLVTLMGWFVILGGLIRMFAPVFAQQRTEQHITAVYPLLIVLFAIGIVLTFKAYGREESKTAVQAEK